MNKSIVSILVASSMIALGVPQVAAEEPGGPEPDTCPIFNPIGSEEILADPCMDAGECLDGNNPACEEVAACLAGEAPCEVPPLGETSWEIGEFSCLMACGTQLFAIDQTEEVLVPQGAVVVYLVECNIVDNTWVPMISISPDSCAFGPAECDGDCGLLVLPPEDVHNVEDVPGLPLPPALGICTAKLWLTANGFEIFRGQTVIVPCIADV